MSSMFISFVVSMISIRSRSDFQYYPKRGVWCISSCFANGFESMTKIINVTLDPIVYYLPESLMWEITRTRIRCVFIVLQKMNEEGILPCLTAGASLKRTRNFALIVVISPPYVKASTSINYQRHFKILSKLLENSVYNTSGLTCCA